MPSHEASSTRMLDYSDKSLKKVPKFDDIDKQSIDTLILDSNEIQKLENIDSFVHIEKVIYLYKSNKTGRSVTEMQIFSIVQFAVVVEQKSTLTNVWSASTSQSG